jgi:hypothetical protein
MARVNVWSDSLRPGVLVGVLVGAVLAAAAAGVARAETTPVPSPTPSPTVTASPSPSPAGTPWPAPTDVGVRVESVLLDANNLPLPPEKQVLTAIVTWPHLAGFAGTYEIEHGIAAIRSSAPRKWQLAGTAGADAAVDGTVRWEEPIQPLSLHYCYRVRTVINGETGPYSAEACIPEPPSSGPAPGPPVVGNSTMAAPGGGGLPPAWLAFAAAVLAGGPLVAGWAALRKRGG